jgi:hypothetical protein
MKSIVILCFFTGILFSQQNSSNAQFSKLQHDLITQNWDLAVKGILLSDNIFLTARQFEYANLGISLIEVPVLLKTKITERLSLLSGTKFDLYRTPFGMSQEVGVSLSSGLQYDFNDNAYIHGVFSYQLNTTSSLYDYNSGSSSSFMLRSGLKF